jgi:hypothetical protein
LANPVLYRDLTIPPPLLPIPQQAKFTLSLGVIFPKVFPKTEEGIIENPAIPAKAEALDFTKFLLSI